MPTLRVAMMVLALAGCSVPPSPPPVTFHARADYPELLSGWGVLTRQGGRLVPGRGVLPYDVNTPLFSDYAHKLRTVWMPDGVAAASPDGERLEFPVGTVLSKTFYYPAARDGRVRLTEGGGFAMSAAGLDLGGVRLVETRLLIRQPDAWDAVTYVWDDAQERARRAIAGAVVTLSTNSPLLPAGRFHYVVPTRDECASCHAWDRNDDAVRPIGTAARHLDDSLHSAGAASQLETWRARGLLETALTARVPNAAWGLPGSLAHRARSYLDVNCGHCHSRAGPADTSGLFLTYDETDPRRLGVCKPPVAAGRGSGGLRYAIVPGAPDASILVHRMRSTELDVAMPELGRATVHEAGVAVIAAWIADLPGRCDEPRRGAPNLRNG